MAADWGDWIPFTKSLPKKREVAVIAGATGRSRHEVLGLLCDLWCWADKEAVDGVLPGTSAASLSQVIGADEQFWQAVVSSGWLVVRDNGIEIPNFGKYLGGKARKRLMANDRKRRQRSKNENVTLMSRSGHADVTLLSRSERDIPSSLPLKEKEKSPPGPPSKERENIPLSSPHPPNPPRGGCARLFDEFWESYPRKQSKAAAFKAWMKLDVGQDLASLIVNAVERQKTWDQWRKEGGAFVPHAATWLNQRRWEDEEHGSKESSLYDGIKAFVAGSGDEPS